MNTVGKLLNEMEHDRGAYDNYQLGIRICKYRLYIYPICWKILEGRVILPLFHI